MTNFKATLELSQDGLEGEIFTKLAFHPLVEGAVTEEDVPGAYQIMSHLVEYYLQLAGIVDEDGDLIDEQALNDTVTFDVQNPSGTLN